MYPGLIKICSLSANSTKSFFLLIPFLKVSHTKKPPSGTFHVAIEEKSLIIHIFTVIFLM